MRGEIHCHYQDYLKEALMQFQVPQNIDLEDKIVGPLTLIQFLYLLGGGVVDYLLFMAFGKSAAFWILGLPIAIVALSLTFLKIQDQPLSHFIKAGLMYLSKPRTRLWQRKGVNITVVKVDPNKIKKEDLPAPKKTVDKSELEKLAHMLDTQTLPK